jgi:LacI family transcriptional regulator, repressor for deo operon, udp, cdd, tsx, nupC, and nupG
LRRPTTAVVAFNDLMALGLIRELVARGLRVPDDVSVAGFDGIFVAELTTPALTTVAAPLRLMGSTAVRHLLAVIEGAQPSVGSPLTLPASLLVRASTGRRRT